MKNILLFIVVCLLSITPKAQTFEPQPDFFRTQREMPLISLATTQDILVSSYGAVINDGQDDLTAIQNAINAAKNAASSSNPVRVIFETGTYDLMPGSSNYSLTISNGNNMVIDGQGAEILIHHAAKGFLEIFSCTNLIVQDLTVDWGILPFTQGVVTAVNSSYEFTVDITEGLPLPTDSQFGEAGERWGVLKDADGSGKIKTGAPNLYAHNTVTHISGNTYKYLMHNTTGEVSVGDYYIDIARTNERTVFRTTYSKNVTYLRTTAYSSPSAVYNGYENYEFNIIDCDIVPKAGRAHSSNADPIHITGGYFGPWVQDCYFEAFTDDVANLKHSDRKILSVVGSTVLQVRYDVKVGDELRIFNPRDGVLLGDHLITNVVNKGNNVYEVTLDSEHSVTEPGEYRFSDIGYLSSRSNESFIFRNNTFKNSRGWGLLLQAKYGEVKGNIFENISSGAIKLNNVPDWTEGFVATDVLITANTFINCGLDKGFFDSESGASIVTKVSKLGSPCTAEMPWCGSETAEWQGLENITFSDNNIEYNKGALHLENIYGLTLSNNTLVRNSNDPYNGEPTPEYINNCTLAGDGSVSGVSVTPSAKTFTQIGQTAQLTANVSPTNADDKTVIWISDDPLVATVNEDGFVTAVEIGTTNIIVTTNDGGYKDTCIVSVITGQAMSANVHFKFDEAPDATEVINTGTETSVYATLDSWGSGGVVTPGFTDSEKGQVVSINNDYNGHIALKNSSGDYPGQTGGSARTYAFWIKQLSNTFAAILYNGSGSVFNVQIEGGGIIRLTDDNDNFVKTSETLTAGEWTHVALVLPEDGNFQDVQFYLNGVTSVQTYVGANNPINTTAGPFLIGSSFVGYMSDFRFYYSALTQEEVMYLYDPSTYISVAGVSVAPNSITLEPTQTEQLTATVTPDDATDRSVTWESNSTGVATVSASGLVTAVADGTASITVTTNDGNFSASCSVTVATPDISVTGISVAPTSITLEPTQTEQLTATVTPNDATDPSVTWESNSTAVATVSASGLVSAVADGTASITVTTNDGNYSASCLVTVSTNTIDIDISNNKFNSAHIFPNPTHEVLNIVLDKKYKNPVVRIVDFTGRTLISKLLSEAKNTIDVSSLTQGIYILYIENGNNQVNKQKIIKIK